MSGELGAGFVVLVFLGAAAGLALAYTLLGRALRRWRGAPVEAVASVPATVTERWEEDRPDGVVYGISARLDDGSTVELYLAGSDHARIAIGDPGVLRYLGDQFRGFTPGPREEPTT